MNESNRLNYTETIKGLIAEFLSIVEETGLLPVDQQKALVEQNILSLLSTSKPRIMLCGVYNAGKSTLLNALYGSEVAAMADKPETAIVTEYEKENYVLIDTPGVNAPIEHERITHEYIKLCHVVFFVISNKGMFEDRKNYEEMLNIINCGKELIIILNNKSGEYDNENHPEVVAIKRKLIGNLAKYSQNKAISDMYSVLFVNARRALKGIVEKKPALYEKSNIQSVQRKIDSILQELDAYKMLRTPVLNFKNLLNEFEKVLIAEALKLSDKNYDKEIGIIDLKRNSIVEEVRLKVRQTVVSSEDDLVTELLNGSEDAFNKVADTIQNNLNGLYDSRMREIRSFINTNFQELDIILDDNFNVSLKDYKTEFSAPSQPHISINYNPKVPESKRGSGQFSCPNGTAQMFQGSLSQGSDGGNVSGIIKFLKNLFKDKEKERYEQLLREAEARNEYMLSVALEQSRIRQETRTAVKSTLYDIQCVFVQEMVSAIGEKFDSIVNQLTQRISGNNEEYRHLSDILGRIGAIKNTLDKISNSAL
ncbi:MAG TPA: GTPase [Clostridia bacterium]|nr:GTPase [Clostridia bacterium]